MSTLNRRKKNLSECDKENQDPVEYHRILLQEHIRRIRGNLPPHHEEAGGGGGQNNHPQNQPQQPLDNEPLVQENNRCSPQRTNRYALYVCTRGKSLLESWGTTFLPD